MALATDIGVDLGTANSLVYVRRRGVILREPSVVAIEATTGRMVAVGEEARRMLGRTPGNIAAIRPLRNGVIADYDITELMLKYFLARVCGRRMLFRPRVMVCIPSGVTTVERRAVLEATMQAGARKTYLIEEPLAAALGAGLDISRPSGNMVADIGGGTTDVAVLSLGGIVISESLRVGGDRFDEAIVRYVRREFNLLIGERTAEEVKIAIGAACPDEAVGSAEVRGRDMLTGLPKTITMTTKETYLALQESTTAIIDLIKSVLERTPPELAADVMDKGIVLTGGGSLLSGMDRLLAAETGVPVHMAEEPINCVAVGTGKALESIDMLKDALISTTRGEGH